MEPFARLVVGYHGCTEGFARGLLLGTKPIRDWQPSTNDWDWLGHGIYFWEHAPERALRWARERYRTRRQRPAVLGAYIQLGRCFDLLDEPITALLGETYERLDAGRRGGGGSLPQNRGREGKLRELDCMVINTCIAELRQFGSEYDTRPGCLPRRRPGLSRRRLLPREPHPDCGAEFRLHPRRLSA